MTRLVFNGLNEADMAAFGKKLGKEAFAGMFIAFYGDLGAGKTTLTRHLAAELGITNVASPTFTIVREHSGKLPLFHFDAYRLGDEDELYCIGFDDYRNRGGVIVMEWCENVLNAMPPERLEIHLEGSGTMPRKAELVAFGSKYERILEGLN